jgi:hypothetical protein
MMHPWISSTPDDVRVPTNVLSNRLLMCVPGQRRHFVQRTSEPARYITHPRLRGAGKSSGICSLRRGRERLSANQLPRKLDRPVILVPRDLGGKR